MSQSAATLLVIEGNDQGTRFDVRESMVIGRGSKNPIRILDTEASRVHARIAPREDGWWLEDLNSSNGTFINGQPIEQKRLESGDQIQLGACQNSGFCYCLLCLYMFLYVFACFCI